MILYLLVAIFVVTLHPVVAIYLIFMVTLYLVLEDIIMYCPTSRL